MMRISKWILPLLALSAFISPVQMTEEALAICCNPFVCGRWSGMVYGDITLNSPTATITLFSPAFGMKPITLDVDPVLEQKFKKDIPEGRAFGFIIIRGDDNDTYPKKPTVVEFVPADPEDHQKKHPVADAVNQYHKTFAKEYAEYEKKKGGQSQQQQQKSH
jgi:hypothetical protein